MGFILLIIGMIVVCYILARVSGKIDHAPKGSIKKAVNKWAGNILLTFYGLSAISLLLETMNNNSHRHLNTIFFAILLAICVYGAYYIINIEKTKFQKWLFIASNVFISLFSLEIIDSRFRAYELVALLFLISAILSIVFLCSASANSSPTESQAKSVELPLHQQMYLEPIKSVTTLSNKLFTDTEIKDNFANLLRATIHIIFMQSSKKINGDDEAKEIMIEFHKNAMGTCEGINNLSYLRDMFASDEPLELLYFVFKRFKAHSFLSENDYDKAMRKWVLNDYVNLEQINKRFTNFVINNKPPTQ